MKRLIAALLALAAAPLAAQSFGPAMTPSFTVVESGISYFTLQDAVRAIGGGQGTIRIAPGSYQECAVQEGGRIRYVAAVPGQVTLDAVTCEQKAALVLRGESAEVHGIIFANLVVPEGNGAGIRIERGDLLVRESLFRDSQSGIVSADDPNGRIEIVRSTFSGLGRCDGNISCAHSIYINGYGALSIAHVRFERGTGGHYVKSRAPRVELVDSSFDDSAGRATNYMIDLPHGADGLIARNLFVQGEDKENSSAFIAVAAEGAEVPSESLSITANEASLVPDLRRRTNFLAIWGGGEPRIQGNQLAAQITELDRR
jgi:hypothetical protein